MFVAGIDAHATYSVINPSRSKTEMHYTDVSYHERGSSTRSMSL